VISEGQLSEESKRQKDLYMTIGEFTVPHSRATESGQNGPGVIIASKNRRIVAY